VVQAAQASRVTPPELRLPPAERLRVNEIFCSLQGESTFAGLRCVLVRLTGCQMRCVWCDTPYAFHQGRWMSRTAIMTAVAAFDCPLVELTGGEPLLQPGAMPLMTALADAGYRVLLETGGGVDISGIDPRVHRILDVKCPGSGEVDNNHWPNLELLRDGDEVKLVLADEADYRFARDLVMKHGLGERFPVHFSPVHGQLDRLPLAEWILRDHLPVRLQLQLHKLVWDPKARGV
jgi:7-carboxy-7-deazaguanine synthase